MMPQDDAEIPGSMRGAGGMTVTRVQPSNARYIRSMRNASGVGRASRRRWLLPVLSWLAWALPLAPVTLQAASDSSGAIEGLREEVTLIRRNAGLFDMRQYELLLQLVDLQSQVGDLEAAAADLSYLQRISESGYGADSIQYGSALAQIASWQCRIGQFMQARETYRGSIRILEQQNATEPLIEALRGFASCCLQELAAAGIATSPESLDAYRGPIVRSPQFSPSNPSFRMHVFRLFRVDGEEALQRAVELSSVLEPKQQLQVLLQAGDWFLGKDYVRAARRFYARADALARASRAEDALTVPTQVLYALPPSALRTRHLSPEETREQIVEVEFTVRGDGHIINEDVIDRGPGKTTVVETLSALRAARYRPRIVQGRTQMTEGVRLRQTFRRPKHFQANAE